MDMRTGELYNSKEDGLKAGVPSEHLVEIEPVIVKITSGPYKGRVYERTPSGIKRIVNR